MSDITIISQTPQADIDIQRDAEQVICDFYNAICLQFTPGKTCCDIKKRIDKIAEVWKQKKHYIAGRQPESFFLNYALGNRYIEVVNKFAGTNIKYRNTTFMDFDMKIFAKMVSIQTAFHLAKFGTVILYEIQLAAILILIKYVKVFDNAEDSLDDKVWCISYPELRCVLDKIQNLNEFDKDFYSYVVKKKDKKPKVLRRLKPETADDYLRFYKDGWNVDQWVEELKYQWCQSRASVFNYFKKFNIKPKEITKNLQI